MVQIRDSTDFVLNENCKAANSKKQGGHCSWERKGIGGCESRCGQVDHFREVSLNQGQFGKIW